MKKWTVVLIFGLAAIGRAALAAEPEPAKPDAEALIRQLSDDRWKVREEATRKLTAMGPAAVPALRKAMGSDDLEVSTRARMIYKWIVGFPNTQQLQEAREQMHKAFADADYPRMSDLGKRITASDGAGALDWLWLGHGAQLAGRWKDAVDAYREVLRMIDGEFQVKERLVGPWDGRGGWGNGPMGRQDAPPRIVPVDPAHRKSLLSQRSVLAMWIARMQTAEIKDPRAAADTLAAAVAAIEKEALDVGRVRADLLKDLAIARLAARDTSGALQAWVKARHLDPERFARALRSFPRGKPFPVIPFVFILSPDQPSATLMLNEPATRQRSYRPADDNSANWGYAFAPPPDKEFATIEFLCDIEQIRPRFGGHFTCFAVTQGGRTAYKTLGGIGWGGEKPTGRGSFRRKFDVPPGVELVDIVSGRSQGFNVHSVRAAATFRAVTKDPTPIAPPQHAWISGEALPSGGTLTCGDKTLRHMHRFAPGRYPVRYEVTGRKDRFDSDLVAEPGGRYSLFINLDSPFRRIHAWAGAPGEGPAFPLRTAVTPLPDGGYLASWCALKRTGGGEIMLSRSRDLVKWTQPVPAAFTSIFSEIAPATCTGGDGTVYLAYFTKRLSLRETGTGGYRLFLTSTRDGRNWTAPRPVSIPGPVGGWPIGAPYMLRGPGGKDWIFWKTYAGSAKSLGEIRELHPIHAAAGCRCTVKGEEHLLCPGWRHIVKGEQRSLCLWNQCVASGDGGRLHMVFDDYARGIYHTTSKDGMKWADPRLLVEVSAGQYASDPQLILKDGKAVLLYWHRGAYLTPVRLSGPPIPAGKGLKITNHNTPLQGARWTVTKEGEVLLPAGDRTA
ncbi:MAG TPA: HEAT repeat domain-containing protein, partial [Phycisphaerae bacterium]|nr:HEAT repeat domain-containing protein [Phycisphaerae bacterium]